MIGKLHGTVIDCKDPISLSKFYAEILGYTVVQSEADWSVIGISEELPGVAFQRISNYVAPTWPIGDIPTQIHFDIRVEDLQIQKVIRFAFSNTNKKSRPISPNKDSYVSKP